MIDRRMMYHPLLGPVIASRNKSYGEQPQIFSPSHDARSSKHKSDTLGNHKAPQPKTTFLKVPAQLNADKYWPRRLFRQ